MIGFIPDAIPATAVKRATVFKGDARFIGPRALRVGEETIEADDIIIATDSKHRPLAMPGAALTITSDDFLTERKLPNDVIFHWRRRKAATGAKK